MIHEIENMPSSQHQSRRSSQFALATTILLVFLVVPAANGQTLTVSSATPRCTTPADTLVGNAQQHFQMTQWMQRGICVRSNTNQCYQTLEAVIKNLSEMRKAEYGSAAGVLTLMPTIGALLGAPTNEIWKLMSIIPFGGALAMSLSFGGAIMPVKVKDYEHVASSKKNVAIGSIISLINHNESDKTPGDIITGKLNALEKEVRLRLDDSRSKRVSKLHLAIGLLGMIALLLGSQAAMTVVEQGGVLAWFCYSNFWMHLWYLMVTLTAVTENWAQLPFVETYKLYVSSMAYAVTITGGESIFEYFKEGKVNENIANALKQLNALKAATVTIEGSHQYTRPRNTVMVMVSVVGDRRFGSFWRLLSKSTSIAVFVTGTALFAAATLLSLQMAVMVLTLNLSAGVFGRAIAGWIVGRVSENEPMIHIIANTHDEAYETVRKVLSMTSKEGAPYQVEVSGHIFISQHRVAKRSSLYTGILGIIAEPYDLRKAHNLGAMTNEVHLPFLEPAANTISIDSSATAVDPVSQSLMYGGSFMSSTGTPSAADLEGHRIPRKSFRSSSSVVLRN